MTPRHDEIVKRLDDGFAVVWDTTKRDRARDASVRKVVVERSAELGRIIGSEPRKPTPAPTPAPRRRNS